MATLGCVPHAGTQPQKRATRAPAFFSLNHQHQLRFRKYSYLLKEKVEGRVDCWTNHGAPWPHGPMGCPEVELGILGSFLVTADLDPTDIDACRERWGPWLISVATPCHAKEVWTKIDLRSSRSRRSYATYARTVLLVTRLRHSSLQTSQV